MPMTDRREGYIDLLLLHPEPGQTRVKVREVLPGDNSAAFWMTYDEYETEVRQAKEQHAKMVDAAKAVFDWGVPELTGVSDEQQRAF